MRAADPAQAARALVFGRTKLCGLNCGADLRAARPAAFAGFVFVPGSPRHVTAERSRAAGRDCSPARACCPSACSATRRSARSPTSRRCSILHAVQLHGARGRRLCARAAPRAAAGVRDLDGAERRARAARRAAAATGCCSTMATAAAAGRFDWALVEDHPELRAGRRRRRASARTMRARRARLAPMRSTSARRSIERPGPQVAGEDRRLVRGAAAAVAGERLRACA